MAKATTMRTEKSKADAPRLRTPLMFSEEIREIFDDAKLPKALREYPIVGIIPESQWYASDTCIYVPAAGKRTIDAIDAIENRLRQFDLISEEEDEDEALESIYAGETFTIAWVRWLSPSYDRVQGLLILGTDDRLQDGGNG